MDSRCVCYHTIYLFIYLHACRLSCYVISFTHTVYTTATSYIHTYTHTHRRICPIHFTDCMQTGYFSKHCATQVRRMHAPKLTELYQLQRCPCLNAYGHSTKPSTRSQPLTMYIGGTCKTHTLQCLHDRAFSTQSLPFSLTQLYPLQYILTSDHACTDRPSIKSCSETKLHAWPPCMTTALHARCETHVGIRPLRGSES
jgi:hypothetical protein